jgi:hypothetical protein
MRRPGRSRAAFAPGELVTQRPPRRFRRRRPVRLPWPLHLVGWLLGAVPVVLLAGWPWLAIAPAAFEAVLLVTTLRLRRRAAPGNGGRPDGPWGAGDREPRRPLPVAGAGAAALPLPAEQWYAKPGLIA